MDLDLLVQQAAQAINAGDDAAVIRTVEALGVSAEQYAPAVWQVARYYAYKEAYGEAAEFFRRAVTLDPRLSSVAFRVGAHTITLRDVAGSTMPALVLEELGAGMYGLRERIFAPGDVIIDVGAHIGVVSILVAKRFPEARVYAYEPASSNFAMLQANLAANGVRNVVAVQAAVAGEPGTLELAWSPSQTAGATVAQSAEKREALRGEGWRTESVRCVTLDEVFATHGIERCAFLKLDCEGAEWGIVRRAAAIERVTAMAMELHIPMSRQAEGVPALQQAFIDILMSRSPRPETVVSSTVWSRFD